MPPPLSPCPACARHVRASETACPFCKAALPGTLPVIPGASGRLTRAAAFAFTTTLATSAMATAASCGGETSGDEKGNFLPPYGIAPTPPPQDASRDADAGDANDGDSGGVQAHYGGVPVDSGSD